SLLLCMLLLLSLFLLSCFSPPPRSLLFPYTTLFRSHAAADSVRAYVPGAAEYGFAEVGADDTRLAGLRIAGPGEVPGAEACALLDRKSTRLNSSHVSISYAVFCLKKKKNQRATNDAA